MIESIVLWALGVVVLIIGYFLAREIRNNEEKHGMHFKHAADDTRHETNRDREVVQSMLKTHGENLRRHEDQDDQRFERSETRNEERFRRFESKLDAILIQLMKNASSE